MREKTRVNNAVKKAMNAGEEWDGSCDRRRCTKGAGVEVVAEETATVSWEIKSLRSMDAVVGLTEESKQNPEGEGVLSRAEGKRAEWDGKRR